MDKKENTKDYARWQKVETIFIHADETVAGQACGGGRGQRHGAAFSVYKHLHISVSGLEQNPSAQTSQNIELLTDS